ncbi:hypothetical protein CGRA01v4_00240 [Colletotrichum graminicola]|nr:hypothetical protein CGRA01v4_00240 [Colletotrichum graminicola]
MNACDSDISPHAGFGALGRARDRPGYGDRAIGYDSGFGTISFKSCLRLTLTKEINKNQKNRTKKTA